MKTEDRFEQDLRCLTPATDPDRDREILDRLLRAQREARATRTATAAPAALPSLLRRPRSALAAAASLAAVALLVLVVGTRTSPRAWAIEETIAALRAYRATHIVAAIPGGTIEMWIRSNPASTQSTEVLVHAPGGVVTWTEGGRTYHHDPATNTVYTEPAVTAGFAPWLGPTLLETLARAPGAKVSRSRESFLGREIVTLIGSLTDVTGPQSWVISFDPATKLPVSFKTWRNLDRRGPPAFDARQITFYDDLPPDFFAVDVPAGARFVERPLSIPEETTGLLADPDDGLPVDGLDRQTAAERILAELGRALVDRDTARFRQLVPLARQWNDDFLNLMIVAPPNDHLLVTGVVEIGRIDGRGRSSLGPIVALPFVTRRADGTKMRDRMIVQFRDLDGRRSCVVFGPHGLPVEVD